MLPDDIFAFLAAQAGEMLYFLYRKQNTSVIGQRAGCYRT